MVTIFVPLWLAVTLRKKEKCSIVIPDWLSVGRVECVYVCIACCYIMSSIGIMFCLQRPYSATSRAKNLAENSSLYHHIFWRLRLFSLIGKLTQLHCECVIFIVNTVYNILYIVVAAKKTLKMRIGCKVSFKIWRVFVLIDCA